VSSKYRRRIADVVQRMRDDPSLSLGQRRRIERLADMSWALELAALSSLWPAIPELVEEYLDVMVSALHEFPEGDVTAPTPLVAPLVPTRA